MLPARLFEAKYPSRSRLPGTPSCGSGSSGLKDLYSYQLSPLLLGGERGHVGAEQPPNLAWLSPHHQSQSFRCRLFIIFTSLPVTLLGFSMSETVPSLSKPSSLFEASWAETRNHEESSNEWHYVYSTVVGFFRQDIARTNPGTLDAVCAVFLAVKMVENLI